jgi:hypothetical protein
MQRLFVALAVTVSALTMASCKKGQEMENLLLTGTWIKGTNAGDTLYFTKTNGKNVLRYNASFNPAAPAVTEIEYNYQNSKLSLRNFMATQDNFYILQSFSWKQEGKEFEVLGYELFPFMSSTQTRFTYSKVN